jgi:hypothetical protein
MKTGGLLIKFDEKSVKISFSQSDENDYKLMELLIALLLAEKKDKVIRRLFDLMFVVISEAAYYDDYYFKKFSKGFKAVKKQRRNG